MTPREELYELQRLQCILRLFEWRYGDYGTIRARAFLLRRMAVLAAALCLILALLPSSALAHDEWINRGGYKNKIGEWCCGEGDCFTVQPFELKADGYHLPTGEWIPFNEPLPSPDGQLWVCRRPDKTRRCVFAPRPSS